MKTLVHLHQGQLRGSIEECDQGSYVSFKGIPYAKPPLGELRFAAPQPPERWIGILEAADHKDFCIQHIPLTNTIKGSEDCLYVNVYTPNIEGCYPVMVSVHSGGFTAGSGNSDTYGPDYIVNEDVVLVTFNYRVGALGFLCLDNEEVPGNAGLKDQVAALRWVKDNISYFGGDPKKVTIFGEGSGSVSVTAHLFSPISKDLFHGAIAQSGVCTTNWTFDSDAANRAFRLGRLLGRHMSNKKELVNFLRSVSPSHILELCPKAQSTEEVDKKIDSIFCPVIEKVAVYGESFLTSPINDLIEDGLFNDVPLIIGYNNGEGVLNINDQLKMKNDINDNFSGYLSGLIRMNLKRSVANKVKELYFNDDNISQLNVTDLVNLRTDTKFALSIYNFAKSYASKAKSPVYFDVFACSSELNMMSKLSGGFNLKMACHGDDLLYLFTSPFLYRKDVDFSSKTGKMVQTMVAIWTNMAKYKDPTPELNGVIETKWEPITNERFNYMNISEQLTMGVEPNKDRLDFLNKLFAKNSIQ